MDSLATPEREAGAAVGVEAAATTGVSPFGHCWLPCALEHLGINQTCGLVPSAF